MLKPKLTTMEITSNRARVEQSKSWRPADEAPNDAWPLAICGTLLCDCDGTKGARIVLTGGRLKGEWVMECSHDVDITHFMVLPVPPTH